MDQWEQVVPKVKGHPRAAEQLHRVKLSDDKLKSDLLQAAVQMSRGYLWERPSLPWAPPAEGGGKAGQGLGSLTCFDHTQHPDCLLGTVLWLHGHLSAVISVEFTSSTGHTWDTPVRGSLRTEVATRRNCIYWVTYTTSMMLLLPLMQKLNSP